MAWSRQQNDPGQAVPADAASAGSRFRRRLIRNRPAVAGLVLVVVLVVAAVVGVWLGHDRYFVSGDEVRQPPSLAHPCGTDDLGRDIFIRILYGAHLTLGTG